MTRMIKVKLAMTMLRDNASCQLMMCLAALSVASFSVKRSRQGDEVIETRKREEL